MKLLFLSDKLLGGTSAYSKIGNETCKRLAKLGHKVAHIPMGYANRMGIITAEEGVQIYPSGANAFGEDVAIEDYLNFKADMLISIKEPWCVPPETLIETPIGQFTIKKFIEKGLWRFIPVKGSKGFAKVLDTQTIACKSKLVEIEISSGKKVRVTKDNLIYVSGKGWMLPTKIKIGDGIRRDYDLAERVTHIKEVSYNGLVYDLTTESGDFFANGILIHNCFNYIPYQPINFVPMCIIDHSPVSTEITSKLNTAFKVIAVSRFGQMELKRADIESYYIPHGVNTSVYKPCPEKKKKYREFWHLDPDAYVIGIVAMNRSRKLISRMLRGYKRFREMNPDVKSQMLLWTDIMPMDMPEEPQMGVADVGVNLLPEILQLGLNEHVIWPHRDLIKHGIPEWSGEDGKWDMVKLYNCFDVLLHCTGGEGFALPLIEAQACSVPVITTDYAAAPEQVGAGLTVRADDYVILNSPGTKYYLANIDAMAEALTKIMNSDATKLGMKARAFALRYDWDRIIDVYWKQFLEKCETELRPLITKEGIKTWS